MNVNAPVFVPSSGALDGRRDKQAQQPPPSSSNKQPQQPQQPLPPHRQQQQQQRPVRNNPPAPSVPTTAYRRQSRSEKGKISLNHLINFTFPERNTTATTAPRRRQKTSAAATRPYNKERFMNANFRFMVDATMQQQEYTVPLADPDATLDWACIQQVLMSSANEETTCCPICLSSPPAAARVTKCGHVFCMPCILHYLDLRENHQKAWRKCPICWEAVYERDLKPVRVVLPASVADTRVKLGDKVRLRLVQRASHSTLALPISETWPIPDAVARKYLMPEEPLVPWDFMPDAIRFARFILASPDYLQREYSRDLVELEDAFSDAQGWGSREEMPYIEQCIDTVKMRLRETRSSKATELAMGTTRMLLEATAKDENSKEKRSSSFAEYYFYQAADGQHVYLHPLDIKVLKSEYGEYQLFPKALEVVVEGVEETTLTEELRKKFKYLGHLPLSCDITFIEIDLKRVVSKETLENFSADIELRRKKRQEKVRREERARKASEAKQKRKDREEADRRRALIENDPFFQTYQANEAMLARAISESAMEARQMQQETSGPKTVWGTPAVAVESQPATDIEWADHIRVTTKKNKNKRKNK